jgi:hypothetical protein
MESSSRHRHRFTALTDFLVSPYHLGFCVYNRGFNVLGGRKHDTFRQHTIQLTELFGDEDVLDAGGRYVSAEFGPRACNPLERHLAKGEYTLYPSHLTEAGLTIHREELSPFVWSLQVAYRVAVKPGETAPEPRGEKRT